MAAKNINVSINAEYSDKDIKRAISDLQKLQATSMSMGGKMQAVGQQMQSMGQDIGKVGKSMTLGLTLPLVGIGVAAIAVQKDFDVAMKSLQVNANATAVDLERLSELAKQMGADTVFSAGEAADAMLELSKGGLSIAAIEGGALAATMNLAATESIGLAEAGGIVVNSMNQFGIAAADSAKVADILAAGAVASTAGVTDLASGLKFVGTTAKQFGFSIGESVTALAALNNAGIDSTTAGTSLNRFMLGLIGTTPKASKTIAQLGLDFKDATGELLPMDKILQVLQDNLSNLSAPARAQALKNIFGIEGMRAANVLLELGSKGFSNLGDQVNKSGVAAELANARMSGVAGALEQLRGSAETAALEIGEVLAPFITQLSNGIKTLVDRFTALPASIQSAIVGIAVIAAAIGPVLLIIGKLVSLAGVLTTALGAITIAGSILAIKVIAVVAVLAAIALAFKYAYDNSEPLRKAVDNLVTTLKNVFNLIKNSVLGAFDSMNGAIGKSNTAFTLIGNYIKSFFTGYVIYLTTIIKVLAGAFQVTMKAFEIGFTILQMGAAIIRGVLVGAFDILMNKLGPISTVFRGVADSVKASFGAIAGFVRSAFNNVGSIVEGFINKAIGAVNVLIRAFNFLAKFLPGVSAATEIAEFRFAELSGAVTSVATGADLAATAVDGFATKAGRANLATQNTAMVSKVAAASLNGLGTAATGAGGAAEKAGDKAKEAAEKFKTNFTAVHEHLTGIVDDIKAKMADMATSVSSSLMNGFQLGDAAEEFGEDGARIGGTFMEKLQEQANKVTNFAAKIKELMALGLGINSPLMQAVMAEGAGSGTAIAQSLIDSGAEGIDQATGMLTAAQGAADEIGLLAAGNFYQAGLDSAQQTLKAFVDRFGVDGKGRNRLMTLMDNLANAMRRETTITVTTINRSINQRAEPRAMGGPVAARSLYMVGERGPELFVPDVAGSIVPSHALSMTGAGGGGGRAAGGDAPIYLTVNAGMGADGAQVGEQIVSALRQYQRRNGALPLTVA